MFRREREVNGRRVSPSRGIDFAVIYRVLVVSRARDGAFRRRRFFDQQSILPCPLHGFTRFCCSERKTERERKKGCVCLTGREEKKHGESFQADAEVEDSEYPRPENRREEGR